SEFVRFQVQFVKYARVGHSRGKAHDQQLLIVRITEYIDRECRREIIHGFFAASCGARGIKIIVIGFQLIKVFAIKRWSEINRGDESTGRASQSGNGTDFIHTSGTRKIDFLTVIGEGDHVFAAFIAGELERLAAGTEHYKNLLRASYIRAECD